MNIHDLELRHLVTFKEVAAKRSVGRAADALGFTQSAVSQQIARLEAVLGQPLFRRPGRTEAGGTHRAGELLLPRVDDLIAQLRSIERDFEGLAEGTVGRLAVGTFQSISVRLLPAVWGRSSPSGPSCRSISSSRHRGRCSDRRCWITNST
jgi:DNA-binding transcriptional LysR family regulator